MSGPNQLSGRRRHAIRPQRTYERVIHATMVACTYGAGPNSLPRLRLNESAAAAQPATAIVPTTIGLGVAWASTGSVTNGAAARTVVLTPFFPGY